LPAFSDVIDALSNKLVEHLYGDDLEWVVDGGLAGLQEPDFVPAPNRGLTAQRGWRFV
jgi:hypothetical protein